jgi:hypothetical protein
MTWLTWRQMRVQALVVIAVAATLAAMLLATGSHLSDLYAADVKAFIDQLKFERFDGFLYLAGLVTAHSIAPVIGAFCGAPLIARELETGTHRLAWTQSTTRHRWLAMKLLITTGVAAVVAGVLSWVVTWWSTPIDKAIAAGHGSGTFSLPRLDPVVFGARGVVAVGYVVFGLAVGTTVGLVLRRSIPAVALTMVVVAAAEILMPHFVRAHLVAPVTAEVAISTDNLRGIQIHGEPGETPSGPIRLSVEAGGPGDWGLANRTVDRTGSAATLPSWFGTCVSMRIGPPPPAGITKTRTGTRRDDLQACFARLTDEGYRQRVTYQPARHFWTLQLRETALLVALAGLLTGFCFWRIGRDAA